MDEKPTQVIENKRPQLPPFPGPHRKRRRVSFHLFTPFTSLPSFQILDISKSDAAKETEDVDEPDDDLERFALDDSDNKIAHDDSSSDSDACVDHNTWNEVRESDALAEKSIKVRDEFIYSLQCLRFNRIF